MHETPANAREHPNIGVTRSDCNKHPPLPPHLSLYRVVSPSPHLFEALPWPFGRARNAWLGQVIKSRDNQRRTGGPSHTKRGSSESRVSTRPIEKDQQRDVPSAVLPFSVTHGRGELRRYFLAKVKIIERRSTTNLLKIKIYFTNFLEAARTNTPWTMED